jgi:Uma2 family endonuclease
VVEISDSSLEYDLVRKAPFYATLGLRDYWVIDARRLVAHIHRDPRPEGYASIDRFAGSHLLTPLLLPSLAVRLADLGLQAGAD